MEPEKYEVSLYVETPQQIRLADGSNAMTLAPVPDEILEDIELHYANISMFLAHPTNMTIDSANNRAILCDSNSQPEVMKTLGRACNAALPNAAIAVMSRSILHVGLFHESAFSSQVNCPVVAYPSSITSNTATKTPIVNFIALPIGVKPAIPCKAVHRSSEFVVYAFAAVSVQTLLQLLRSIPSQDPRTNSSADAQGLWLVVQPPKSTYINSNAYISHSNTSSHVTVVHIQLSSRMRTHAYALILHAPPYILIFSDHTPTPQV